MEEKATTIAANINGRRLVGRKAGKGGPTVVLEMGLRATGSFYDDIAEPLATFTMLKKDGLGKRLCVSLHARGFVAKELSGQLQVALVQGTMFDHMQQSLTHGHRLFLVRRTIVHRHVYQLIEPFIGERIQHFLHRLQEAFVACG